MSALNAMEEQASNAAIHSNTSDTGPKRIQNTCGEWFWTVPPGYKTPTCDGCGHKFWDLKPQRSIGGASVRSGYLCSWCQNGLCRLGELGE